LSNISLPLQNTSKEKVKKISNNSAKLLSSNMYQTN